MPGLDCALDCYLLPLAEYLESEEEKDIYSSRPKKSSNLKKGDKIIYATTFDVIDDKSNRWLVEILSKTSKGYKDKFIADKSKLRILFLDTSCRFASIASTSNSGPQSYLESDY